MTLYDIPEPSLDPPERPEPKYPVCPWCGAEFQRIYFNRRTNELAGCDHCLESLDYWEEETDERIRHQFPYGTPFEEHKED